MTDELRRQAVQSARGPQPPQAAGRAPCERRTEPRRVVRAPRHDPPGRDAAPERPRGSQPGLDPMARPGKAALPQLGATAGDLRALDREIRAAAPAGAPPSETTSGGEEE